MLASQKASASDDRTHLFMRHVTTSYLLDGRADYSGARAPSFRYIYLDVEPLLNSQPKGTLTLNPKGEVLVDYYDNKDVYAGVKPFSKGKSFPLVRHDDNDSYCLVDDRDRHGEFYRGSETYFSRSDFSIDIGETQIKGRFPMIQKTNSQMAGKHVPYVELIRNGSQATGVKWRFVDPADPATAVARQKRNDVSRIRRIVVSGRDWNELHYDGLDLDIAEGDMIEGESAFGSPVGVSEIQRVRIDFLLGESDAADNIETHYSWWFYPKR